jgi:hypothetical protein
MLTWHLFATVPVISVSKWFGFDSFSGQYMYIVHSTYSVPVSPTYQRTCIQREKGLFLMLPWIMKAAFITSIIDILVFRIKDRTLYLSLFFRK